MGRVCPSATLDHSKRETIAKAKLPNHKRRLRGFFAWFFGWLPPQFDHWFFSQLGHDHGGVPPPVRPQTTHLLFAQSGRIEHVPLEGFDMKKDEAKAIFYLPVSFSFFFFKEISGIISSQAYFSITITQEI